MFRVYPVVLFFAIISFSASAQYRMQATEADFNSFSTSREQKLTLEAEEFIPQKYRSHPEYARNPYNAPCEGCTELIDRRKEDERYFVKDGTQGKTFYVQKSEGPLHILDNSGNWVSIDTRLSPTSTPGIFGAENQSFPLKIDVVNHFSSIKTPGNEIKFNTALELLHKDLDGNLTSIGEANWSNYTAGDDGVKVIDAWQGIDMEIQSMQGKIKTNFIVKNRLPFSSGWLIIKDKLNFSDNLLPNFSLAERTGENLYEGNISFYDREGQEYYTIDRAFARGAIYGNDLIYLSYQLTPENDFLVYVPVDWLADSDRIYPVTIDPLVSASNNLALASISGSQYGATCFTNGCPYTLSVPVPANCTVTDVRFTFNYNALGGCFMNEGAMDFSLGSCRSPNQTGFYWYCNPTPPAGGACNGNNISIYSDIASCIPNPQCAPYGLTFGMKFYRCNPSGGNSCSNSCIAANSPWTMTVEGRTVEIPGISPSQTICVGNSATINGSGNYGVPPYIYSWSPGGMTGTSITVSPTTNTTYTATVTDACGQIATANAIVNVTQNTNPGFTITPNPVCTGQTVTVNGLGVGPSSSYDWLFPGAVTSIVNNNKNPNVVYNTAGTYNMTLNFAQGVCVFPLVQQVTVTPNGGAASVTISANPSGAICSGTSVTFTANPTNGGSAPTYQWQVNGLNAGTGATFTTSTLNSNDAVTVVMTSNANCISPLTATSSPIIVTISPAITPSVTISANPSGTICAGTSLTFTATPANGGSAPTYQWQVNGINAGTGATFNSNTLNNGDLVRVILTSNANCVSPSIATSNALTITVNPSLTPAVTIAANPSGAICPGTAVTFTATPTNGGGAPTYQWQVNGSNTGTGATFSTTSLNNGDVVSVIMTSNANCAVPATATSNSIIISVTPAPIPSVTISALPTGPICPGTSVSFTASPTNGGLSPSYQWQINGTNAGTGSSFSSTSLNNGDVVRVIMTSNATCASPATATSNTVTITVTPNLVPTVTISANPSGPVCSGTNITFTPAPTNGGVAPTYQWKVNGITVGNFSTYSTSSLTNGAVVTVIMTSNASCALPTTATSNSITMVVFPIVSPTVSIAANPSGTICSGTSVTFTSTITNGGTSPVYQWQVNGTNTGTGATFTSTTLNNGDIVSLLLTSNAPCVSPLLATSNSINMSVTATVIPTITIAAVPSGQICNGTNVTFTASHSNGGASPTYQWQVNGSNTGTGTTFTSSTLNNNDIITVVMTSNATCASPSTATSTPITMNVSSVIVPTVAISASPSNTICAGENVIVTATPSGGGNNPTYQWTLNGINAGNGATFSSTGLNNADVIEVVMTSSSTCANPQSVTSNSVTMLVTQPVVPSVSIADFPSGNQCAGTAITFTPTAQNGGNNPAYQWQVNGTNAGTGNTYSSSSLNDGDIISVVMTSIAACANPTTAASNSITVAIDPVYNPSVSVSSAPNGTICAGTQVDFVATPNDAGPNPTYQWTINGANAGTGNTFSSTNLNDGDLVVVTLTSTSACAIPSTAASSPIVMDVNLYVTPSVSITASPSGPLCDGATVTYTANGANGGSNPVYQWQVNGLNAGNGGTTFSSNSLNDGDIVTVSLTSSATCTNGNPAISNQITISLVEPLEVVASDDITVCSSTPSTLTAIASGGDGTYGYTWNNGAGNGSSVNVNPAQTTTYTVSVSDQCGSTPASDDVTISVSSPVAQFEFTPEIADMFDAQIRFENNSQGATDYFWDFGDGYTSSEENPAHTFGAPGHYAVTLTVTSSGGCEETISYLVIINDVIAFWVPSAFTPNGDGINDVFFMQGTFDKPYVLRIYNRLGSEIYFTDNSEPWNGAIFNAGEVVPNGIYVYEFDLDDSDYKFNTIKGYVTLIRDGR